MKKLLERLIVVNSYLLLFSISVSIPLTRICVKFFLILMLIKFISDKLKPGKYDVLPLIMPIYQTINSIIHKVFFDFLRRPNGLIPVGTLGLRFVNLDLEKSLKFLLLGGLFLALGILAQSFFGVSDYRNFFKAGINFHLSMVRPWHTFVGRPLTAGAPLSISLFLSLTFYLFTKQIRYLLLSFIFLVAVILTFDRSYWLATISSYFIYILIISLRKFNKNLLITFFSLALITVLFLVSFKTVKDRWLLISNYKRDTSSLYRLAMWKGALNYYANSNLEHKLFGIGNNRYTEKLKLCIIKEEKKLKLPIHIYSHLHSDFITVLVWYGFIGLVIFLITFLTFIFVNLKAFYNEENLLFLFFTVAYTTLLLAGIFEYNFEDEAVKYLIYALFGLNIKLIERAKVF